MKMEVVDKITIDMLNAVFDTLFDDVCDTCSLYKVVNGNKKSQENDFLNLILFLISGIKNKTLEGSSFQLDFLSKKLELCAGKEAFNDLAFNLMSGRIKAGVVSYSEEKLDVRLYKRLIDSLVIDVSYLDIPSLNSQLTSLNVVITEFNGALNITFYRNVKAKPKIRQYWSVFN